MYPALSPESKGNLCHRGLRYQSWQWMVELWGYIAERRRYRMPLADRSRSRRAMAGHLETYQSILETSIS